MQSQLNCLASNSFIVLWTENVAWAQLNNTFLFVIDESCVGIGRFGFVMKVILTFSDHFRFKIFAVTHRCVSEVTLALTESGHPLNKLT